MWEICFKILVLWIALLGAVATRENQHIKIDLLERFLPPVASTCGKYSTFSSIICGLAAYWSGDLVY